MPPRILLVGTLLGLLALACQPAPAAPGAGAPVQAPRAVPAGAAPGAAPGQPLQKVVIGYLAPSEAQVIP